MSLTLSGNLKKPDGSALGAAEIVFHAVRTSSGVPEGVTAEFQTDAQGAYTATVEFGRYDIYVRADTARAHTRVAKNALIDANTTETNLNSLVLQWQGEQDITPEIVVEFRDIQADVQANRDEVDSLTTHVNNQTLHVDQQVNHVDSQVAHVDSQATFVDGRANDADASAIEAASSEAAAAASETAAANSESNALASETAARSSEVAAAGSASAASTSETNAKASETAAATSETNAAASESAAATSEANAAASESAAASSASSADTSESWAEKWAQNPYNTAVKTGQYSSLHHAKVADNHRAAALQSAVDASDARTGAETAESNAKASETAAAASESAAATSETNAAASESAAALSESNAAASETAAKASENAAAASENAAATSESNAAASESAAASSASAAATSESNAKASEDEAEQWATSLTKVDGTYFGARKYAQDASASESAAAASESNAASSEAAAAASESAAASSESAAATSETNAKASEDAAAASESAAASSESNAKASETAAAGSASAASTSETNAAASESAAASSASAAATSETNAASSASAAASSEDAAKMSENAAADSESAAAASESAAASSEALAQAWATKTDAPVSGDLYGAKYYADQARTTLTGTLIYRGTWDATTALPAGPKTGDLYKVSVAGGDYNVGDQIVYNGTSWDHIDNTEQVTSVGGNVGDITDTQLREAVKRVDGAGSGLDADLLDGIQASQLLRKDTSGTLSGDLRVAGDLSADNLLVNYGTVSRPRFRTAYNASSGRTEMQTTTDDGGTWTTRLSSPNRNHPDKHDWLVNDTHLVWHSGNDGPGSGLNADVLDGKHLATIESEYQAAADAAESAAKSHADTGLAKKLNSSAYTAADVLAKVKTVDGSGSGLDADTLDGLQASALYERSEGLPSHQIPTVNSPSEVPYGASGSAANYPHLTGFRDGTGQLTFTEAVQKAAEYGARLPTLEELDAGICKGEGHSYDYEITWTCTPAGPGKVWGMKGSGNATPVKLDVANDTAVGGYVANKVVTPDSVYLDKIKRVDGAGSGLDADKLDGKHASAFANASHSHPWNEVNSKPATATRWPSFSEVTSKPATATRWPSWSEVTSKPGSFTPSAHNHSADEITSGVLAYARIPTIRHGDTNFANQALNTGSSVQHATVRTGGTADDGTNSLQVQGGTRTDTLAAGSVQAPQESIDTDGNAQIRGEGQLKMGDFAIQYNAATKSLDFNWIGG